MPYSSVVVGTDGSETAEAAVRHAAGLAKLFDARLTVVTGFTSRPEQEARRQAEAPQDVRWLITDAASADERARRGRAIARDVGVQGDVVIRVDSGDPAALLLDAADDMHADVIVVGSKGMTSAKRFVLGNVPNKVSHHAPCDVVIVHTAP